MIFSLREWPWETIKIVLFVIVVGSWWDLIFCSIQPLTQVSNLAFNKCCHVDIHVVLGTWDLGPHVNQPQMFHFIIFSLISLSKIVHYFQKEKMKKKRKVSIPCHTEHGQPRWVIYDQNLYVWAVTQWTCTQVVCFVKLICLISVFEGCMF